MSGFSAEWLTLREPLDAVSRDPMLTQALVGWCKSLNTVSIIDLGCGTGANLRFLVPRLGGRQEWLLVDNDPQLLDDVESHTLAWTQTCGARLIRQGAEQWELAHTDWHCRIRTHRCDLARLDTDLELTGVHLVTASALLDLVTNAWLEVLAQRCQSVGAAVFFALTYDGRIHWTPTAPDDKRVQHLVNRHQQTDKGFGPALGPQAVARAGEIFTARGYRLATGCSEWLLGPESTAIQRTLLADWVQAATAVAPLEQQTVEDWRQQREDLISLGRSELTVGHVDLFGWR